MNSEKVKEIKKKLQQINERELSSLGMILQFEIDVNDILTLINELESDNKELRVVTDIANERTYRKKFTDEWRKEYQKELDKQGNGHIAGHPDFDLVYKLYFEQKDRIAKLEEGIAKSMLGCEFLPEFTNEKLKQFAEKLKEKFNGYGNYRGLVKEIDELLKEYEK